jgi:hypothetical protein
VYPFESGDFPYHLAQAVFCPVEWCRQIGCFLTVYVAADVRNATPKPDVGGGTRRPCPGLISRSSGGNPPCPPRAHGQPVWSTARQLVQVQIDEPNFVHDGVGLMANVPKRERRPWWSSWTTYDASHDADCVVEQRPQVPRLIQAQESISVTVAAVDVHDDSCAVAVLAFIPADACTTVKESPG